MNSPPIPPQAQELLAQLEPIITPPPVGLWPLAPGWWLLLFLVVGTIAAATYWLFRNYKYNAYRRQAMALLKQLTPEANSAYVKNITALLKRTALSAYPSMSAHINTSYGTNWSDFLSRANPKATFNGALASALSEAAYTQHGSNFDPHELKRQASKWVKTHPRKCRLQEQVLLEGSSPKTTPSKTGATHHV